MESINTSIENFTIRFAEEKDNALILNFIKELAEYEKMTDDVVTTEEVLYDSLFNKHAAEVIFGEYKGEPVAFALFFHNFSTFIGKPGLYLEDIFVKKEYRGNGYGKVMLSFLENIAKERNCGRMEWACLDWNKPSIEFYKNMGAKPMEDWTIFRLTEDKF